MGERENLIKMQFEDGQMGTKVMGVEFWNGYTLCNAWIRRAFGIAKVQESKLITDVLDLIEY